MLRELHQRLLQASERERTKAFLTFESFLEKLKKQKEIRFLMDFSKRLGHQSSCAHIIKQLSIMLDAEINIVLVYDGGISIIEKIKLLFPSFKDPATPIKIAKATVSFVEYFDNKPLFKEPCTFAFAGGFEINSKQEFILSMPRDTLVNMLNAQYLLNVFPAKWYIEDHIFIKDAETCYLGGNYGIDNNFNDYIFRYPTSVEDAINWEDIEKDFPEEKEQLRIKMTKSLLGYVQEKKIELCPVYGLSMGGGQVDIEPEEILSNLTAGILQAQKKENSQVGKTVILLLENEKNFPKYCLDQSQYFIMGSPTISYAFEDLKINLQTDINEYSELFQKNQTEGLRDQTTIQLALLIKSYSERLERTLMTQKNIEKVSASLKMITDNGISVQFLSSLSIANLDEFSGHIKRFIKNEKTKILILSLHNIPPELYQYVFNQASLPSVFEGQNTASLAMYLGKPYLRLKQHACTTGQQSFRPTRYPCKMLPENNKAIAKECELAADCLHNSFETDDYEKNIQILSKFIIETHKKKSDIKRYFQDLRKVYFDPINDRLLNACNILYVASETHPGSESLSLKKLHEIILQKIKKDKFILIPDCIPSITIREQFESLLSKKEFSIANTKMTPHFEKEDLTHLTLTGETDSFGPKSSVEISFKMWMGRLTACCTATCLEDKGAQFMITSSETKMPAKILISGF